MRHTALQLALVLLADTAAAQTITTVVGGGPNNLPALEANLVSPRAVRFDGAGNFYISVGSAVLKVDASGMLTLVAGNGTSSFGGDGGPATEASLNGATGVALDAAGNVFIADTFNARVRRVDAATGTVSTAAGNGTSGLGCDSCAATSASLTQPVDVAFDAGGNLYILESSRFFTAGGHRVRRLDAATGIIRTVAGTGVAGFSGDGGPATNARLSNPSALALDAAGNLFIADSANNRIRRVAAATGIITTMAGNGVPVFGGDGGPATSASLAFPLGVAVDVGGNLYIADTNNRRIRKVDSNNVITTIAGNGTTGGGGDGGPATSASLITPAGVTVGSSGNVLVADRAVLRVREIVESTGLIRTVAGNGTARFSGDGYAATGASLNFPLGVAVDGSGTLYLTDAASNRVRRVDASGIITTFVGGGIRGFVATPYSLATDPSGNLYIADQANHRIKKVDTTGTISTVAGNGARGFSGDGGPAASASLNFPSGVAADGSGNIYVADSQNLRVRKIDAAGIITTVADGLSLPRGLAVDPAGTLYIAETGRCRVRKVDAAGVITTVAGDGRCSFGNGDGVPATSASLNEPEGVLVDASGSILIADTRNHRVRQIDSTGIISTVAGNGARAFGGDEGPATNASLALPTGIALDASGALYIADRFNHRIRRVVLNHAPSADAGADQCVPCTSPRATEVRLDGSRSFDPDGNPLTYVWTGAFAENGGTASGVSPTVTLPLGTATTTLVVNDGTVDSAPDSVDITVKVRVEGFDSPLAALVPEGDAIPHPDRAFRQGRVLPLKLHLFCGATELTDADVAGPQIVDLVRDGDAINLETIDAGAGETNDSGLAFRFADGRWVYNLKTTDLTTGTYVITLGTPDGLRYSAVFVLR